MITIMRKARKMPRGGQPGNQNTIKDPNEVKDSVFTMRCRRRDKAAWVRASKKAKREGKFTHEGYGGLLAAWAIAKLNAAADRELGPVEAAKRKGELSAAGAAK